MGKFIRNKDGKPNTLRDHFQIGDYTLGSLTATSLTVTGDLTASTGNVTADLIVGNTVSAGQLSGADIILTGNVITDVIIGNSATISGNIATTGGSFIGDGSQLTGISTSAGGNDTEIQFNSSGSFSGSANLTFVDGFGLFTLNPIESTGNVTGGNIVTLGTVDTVDISASGAITATGNVTGGNLLTGNVTIADATVVALGNITGGNLITGGLIDATGNVTGGNLITGGELVATGNVTGAYLFGDGSNLTGVTSDPAGADTQVQFNDSGNVAGDSGLTFDKTTDTLTVGGSISATAGNVDADSFNFTSLVFGSGNVLAGNINSYASGNVFGGNVVTGNVTIADATVTAVGNVVGGNLTTAGQVTATGNVTGGNLITGAQVVATGNVTGGNLVTSADVTTATVTATGNISVGGILLADIGTHEKFGSLSSATGTVTHDCSNGHIFYHTSPSADFTANFTNLNLGTTYATTTTLVMIQGATARIANAVQIGGSAQTINWQGGSEPTGTNNGIDVITFSILNNSGTYTVLGQLVDF